MQKGSAGRPAPTSLPLHIKVLTLRICAEAIDVGASLVGAQATASQTYEGNHKGCPYHA